MEVLGSVAAMLGAPEAALRLLLSLLVGYPLIYLHRRTLYRADPTLQHAFFVACGLALGIFNNGSDVLHSVVCVLTAWLSLVLIGPSQSLVVFANIFQMSYLVIGYYVTATETYDIKWTMPHCVLTLRLVALSWDYYDGNRDEAKLSKDQKESCLQTCPSLLEVAAHTYFPASYLVGPQFSMRRYLDFVHGRLFTEQLPDTVSAGLQRGALGLLFVAVYQVGSGFLPDSYLISEEFDNSSLAYKALYLALWGKVTLYKYNCCWLIVEGVLIMSGLSYAPGDPPSWDACENISILSFEKGYKFSHLIESFNINTNKWLMQYVYKRLKFVGSRHFSAFSALMFLALWHGLHTGYYSCFILEFLVNEFEKRISNIVSRHPRLVEQLDGPLIRPARLVLMKLYVMVFFGYCLAPFVLLQTHRWMALFQSCYFLGHLMFAGVFLYEPLLRAALRALYGAPVSAGKTE